ncbi:MAG: hypothetical protein ACREOE_10925 [Gemmatimonadales bacterium]
MALEEQRTSGDRRRHEAPVIVDRRVREIDRRRAAQHAIAVGPTTEGFGWMHGRCSCGSEVRSRVQGVIDEWAKWHLNEVAAMAQPGLAAGVTFPRRAIPAISRRVVFSRTA